MSYKMILKRLNLPIAALTFLLAMPSSASQEDNEVERGKLRSGYSVCDSYVNYKVMQDALQQNDELSAFQLRANGSCFPTGSDIDYEVIGRPGFARFESGVNIKLTGRVSGEGWTHEAFLNPE